MTAFPLWLATVAVTILVFVDHELDVIGIEEALIYFDLEGG
jgi:hypothetical protein